MCCRLRRTHFPGSEGLPSRNWRKGGQFWGEGESEGVERERDGEGRNEVHVLCDTHVNERWRRKKQARSNKQQNKATQHTQGSHFSKVNELPRVGLEPFDTLHSR